MSNQAAGSGTPPQTPEALAADIERTRQELGETVEALVAKTDVKARARHRAAEVTANLRGKARAAVERARDEARDAKHKAREAKAKAAGHTSATGGRVYGAAAAAVTAVLIVTWLAVRRRRR